MSTTTNRPTKENLDRITDLMIRPRLAADQIDDALSYLVRLLILREIRQAHIAHLETLAHARFEPFGPGEMRELPPPLEPVEPDRRFRYHNLLDDAQLDALYLHGPEVLRDESLFPIQDNSDGASRLLLNPYALWDLANVIAMDPSDYWLDRMHDHADDLAREVGLDPNDKAPLVQPPVTDEEEKSNVPLAGSMRKDDVRPENPDSRPGIEIAPSPNRGHRIVLTVGAILAVAAALFLFVFPLLAPRKSSDSVDPNPLLASRTSSDSVDPDPIANMKDLPNRKTVGTVVFRQEDRPLFVGVHPGSLRYQWLMQVVGSAEPVAGSAKLVASAGEGERFRYRYRQLDSDWGADDNRREYLVIVTSDKVLPGWPEKVTDPVPLDGLFSVGELRELRTIPREPDIEKQVGKLKRVLRKALDRKFDPKQYWFHVCGYECESSINE